MSRYSNYNNSSLAYDYDDYEQEQPQEVVRRTLLRRVKKRTRYVNNKKKNIRLSAFTVFNILLFFGASLYLINIMAMSNFLRRQNIALNAELRDLRSRTNELIVEINNNMDLNEIEAIARTRLRMSEPSLHQIIEIQVPRENYIIFGE